MADSDRRALVELLKENNGKLGNKKALLLLTERLGRPLEKEEYERIKEQLLLEGAIRRAQGQGGSIQLLESAREARRRARAPRTGEDQIEILFTSLSFMPGVSVKRNSRTITILCGEDNDKLYCGWDESKSEYYIQYRLEPGKEDCSDTAEYVFGAAVNGIQAARIQRVAGSVFIWVEENIAVVNQIVGRLRNELEETTLKNGPQRTENNNRPHVDDYFSEIAAIIKLCVDNNLRWPLKNWRKTLGFDDVDELIVIGHSPIGAIERYREHVVPAVLIKEEAVKLAQRGAPEKVIADFIQHHLYVVLISKKEAEMLNKSSSNGGLSLKTSMPEGWVLGCDPMERLKAAGINVSFTSPIPVPEWKPWKKPSLKDKIVKFVNTPVITIK